MNARDCIISQSILHRKYPDIFFKKSITRQAVKYDKQYDYNRFPHWRTN